MSTFKYGEKFKEIAYGPRRPKPLTAREYTQRFYPHLIPTEADIKWAHKGSFLAGPGVTDYFDTALAWAKEKWPWLLGGGLLYAALLVAVARRGRKAK